MRASARPHHPPASSPFLGFLVTWQAIVRIGDYPAFILPAPLVVAERFVRAWLEATFWPHLLTTLQEIAVGFTVGAAAALPTGYILARSRLASRILSPYLVAAQAVPILALAPLIALWFGSGLLARSIISRPGGLLPGGDQRDDRRPRGRPAPPRDGPQLPRDPAPADRPRRDPGRSARRSWGLCGSGSPWPWSGPSSPSGRRRRAGPRGPHQPRPGEPVRHPPAVRDARRSSPCSGSCSTAPSCWSSAGSSPAAGSRGRAGRSRSPIRPGATIVGPSGQGAIPDRW